MIYILKEWFANFLFLLLENSFINACYWTYIRYSSFFKKNNAKWEIFIHFIWNWNKNFALTSKNQWEIYYKLYMRIGYSQNKKNLNKNNLKIFQFSKICDRLNKSINWKFSRTNQMIKPGILKKRCDRTTIKCEKYLLSNK